MTYRTHAGWCAVCALLLTGGLARSAPADAEESADARILNQTSRAFSRIAQKAIPAVVFIKVEKVVPAQGPDDGAPGPFGDDLFDFFFRGGRGPGGGQPPQQRMVGQGTGFLISPDGYILSNHHIVSDARRIQVKLHDGREFDAEFVGSDPRSEVAVIRIKGEGFPAIPLGDSDAMDIGEWVIAIGNPFGLSETLTVGVVSAKGRSNIGITDYEDFIQTDAAINPGNSGGPLLNVDGKVIGINTAIYSQTGGSLGIGFAIPINMATAIKDQLIASGNVERGYLGIGLQDLTPDVADSLGVAQRRGALVTDVVKESPAASAGLEVGDVIVALGGKPMDGAGAVRNHVAMTAPGAQLKLALVRGGKTVEKTAKIGTREGGGSPREAVTLTGDKLGLTIEALTEGWRAKLGFEPGSGVLVASVQAGSPAHQMGIQPGNLIQSVNNRPVRTEREFHEAAAKALAEGRILLLVRDSRGARFVAWRFR